MLKLKLNHTSRDVKVLTDQLVDAVAAVGTGGPEASPFMEDVLRASDAGAAQTALGLTDLGKSLSTSGDAGAALTALGVSDFAKGLLNDASASTALSTLGVSTFAQSLLDDADASTALSTLGVSSFAKTLLDDADAEAALTTLGALSQSKYENRKQYRPYNYIHNGDFYWFRWGSSGTYNGIGPAERWHSGHIGSSKTASVLPFAGNQTAVPGFPKYYLRTVVNSAAGAANCTFVQYPLESVETLSGKTVTATFWAKSDANRSISACFTQFFGWAAGSSAPVHGIGATKFELTTVWKKCQIVLTIPSIAGKTTGNDYEDTLDFRIWFDAGSNYSSRTAGLTQQSGTFDIARVSIVEGDASDVADPFFPHEQGLEERELRRFYNYFERYLISGYAGANGYVYCDIVLPVAMYWSPGVFFFSTTYSNSSALALNLAAFDHVRLQLKMNAAGSGYCQTGIEFYANLYGYYD